MTIVGLFKEAVAKESSDIFIIAGLPLSFKINGQIVRGADDLLTPTDTADLISQIYELANRINPQIELKDDDFSFAISKLGRFRVNVYHQRGSKAAVIRIVGFKLPHYETLNIPKEVMALTELRRGLVLITGPAGAGKSTTISCMIDKMRKTRKSHIITLEDPIEYMHQHEASIISQREIGVDTPDYKQGLKSALRQAPDVIFLGEMRDYETIQIAMTAAETGQLVLSTLHTLGAVNTIDRIIDVFPPLQQQQVRIQLSMVLEAIISQQLIPTINNGQIPVFEVIPMSYAIRNMIREAKLHQLDAHLCGSGQEGIQHMDEALLKLYEEKRISAEQARFYSMNYEMMCKKMKQIINR